MKPCSQKAHFLAPAKAALLDMFRLQVSAGNHHANFQLVVIRNSSDLGPGFGNAYAVRMRIDARPAPECSAIRDKISV
jgi:hypothetical protein